MSLYKKLFIIAVTYQAASCAMADFSIFTSLNNEDICPQLCNSESLNIKTGFRRHCERGCRIFDITLNTNFRLGKAFDLNATKLGCDNGCRTAYVGLPSSVCVLGCQEMYQLQREAWLFYLQQRGDNTVVEVEVSLVSDPALWEQTLETSNVYRLPQTYIKTMPMTPQSPSASGGVWSACAPPLTEIPRWLVGLLAAALTLFTLYVYLILPGHTDSSLLVQQQQQDEDDEEEQLLKKQLPITVNQFLTEDYHANIVPPPKYSELVDYHLEDECSA